VIGIVIVSHSASLAAGVLELAREMAGPDAKLAAAGGMALPGHPLGTDPALVAEAIRQVHSADGVVVLMDLGSAVLSAEMALELLPAGMRERVFLCEAPLVEGAVSAAVQARLGSGIDQVLAEARGALAAKIQHLHSEAQMAQGPSLPPEPPAETLSLRLVVGNRLGLHARPAARFVQTAGRFPEARIQVRNLSTGRGPVEAKSINAIAMLGLTHGQTMGLEASGTQAEVALAALRDLAEHRFGDPDGTPDGVPDGAPGSAPDQPPPPAPRRAAGDRELDGLIGSPGLALGPARHLRTPVPVIPRHPVADPEPEWARLLAALERTRAEIRATQAGVAHRLDRAAADVFEAHLLFLDDPSLRDPARRMVFDDRLNAAAAWHDATEAVAREYRGLDDDYLRTRAADVLAVGTQVVGQLLGQVAPAPELASSGVLIAADLSPAETARLDPARVRAICTAYGAATSHSAILARALGIPAVVGLGQGLLDIPEDTPMLVDAERGRIVLDPGEDLVAAFQARQEDLRAAAARAQARSGEPAITRDGRRVEIGANIGSLADARAAVAAGAEGVGLLRTEFLFNGRSTAPDEAEQLAVLSDLARSLDGRPMIIRTLDAGGDKPLPFLDTGCEANPFLGWRAIRICLAQPEFFKVQLRAIVRTAARFPVKVMFPMIATLGELRAAKGLLAEAMEEVRTGGHQVPERIETGIMVEIPAAAVRADQFAPEVDFFSIGTNDLTQYTMAAERGNARVAALADPFQPAVLELLLKVVAAGHAHGKWVGVCGELAGDPLAIPLLVGLGIDEISMSTPMIPRAKQLIRDLDYPSLRASALLALRSETPEQVRATAAIREP
jgi:phosphocarrier protein FPr